MPKDIPDMKTSSSSITTFIILYLKCSFSIHWQTMFCFSDEYKSFSEGIRQFLIMNVTITHPSFTTHTSTSSYWARNKVDSIALNFSNSALLYNGKRGQFITNFTLVWSENVTRSRKIIFQDGWKKLWMRKNIDWISFKFYLLKGVCLPLHWYFFP